MSKVVVLIPARYQSSRFPGKPLALLKNKTMIERVYQNAASSGLECAVVTDDDRIEAEVKKFGGKVIRVDDDVPSGSERIALAYERFYEGKADLVINVQGDEPLLPGESLKLLADFHLNSKFDVATMVRPRKSSEEDFKNPNVVKAVLAQVSGQCLYFSRASLPFDRDQKSEYEWHQHIGVYSYRPKALKEFVKAPVARLEDLEKLEQLRAMEMGFSIGALSVNYILQGVDTPDDVQKVERYL
jgi:3-deoxy-manno-octulosonate cytidylyltransferase (CMP-KDO synthetase)